MFSMRVLTLHAIRGLDEHEKRVTAELLSWAKTQLAEAVDCAAGTSTSIQLVSDALFVQ
jgi:hypothetical protein